MSENRLGAEQSVLPPGDGEVRLGTSSKSEKQLFTVGLPENTQNQAVSQAIIASGALTSGGTSSSSRTLSLTPIRPSAQSIVNALTRPRTETGTSPGRKRSRNDELPPGCDNLAGARARAMEHKWARSKCIKESYYEHCAELYFLESGGNMLDYFAWRKRPRTAHYSAYLRQNQLEPVTDGNDAQSGTMELTPPPPLVSPRPPSVVRETLTPASTSTTTVNTETKLNPPVLTVSTFTSVPETKLASTAATTTTTAGSVTVTSTTATTVSSVASPRPGITPSTATANKTKSIASAFPGNGNPEHIVEKAKQEAYVMQRISELQRDGLWTERRLPKVQEVQRCKSHWDYLLEEMVWLAADFAQERKWKKAAAKKCARMVQKYFQDKALAAQKAEKAQELQLKRIAAFIAKEIKTFWANVEKLVEFKQQAKLEEKRKQALDQHLSFIVDQTEKYSQLLAEGMNKGGTGDVTNSGRTSPKSASRQPTDDEFNPEDQSSTDDEETIAQAEAADEPDKQTEELAALQRESEMDFEDFLNELPKDYLENRDKIVLDESASEKSSESGGDSDTEQHDDKKKSVKDDKKKDSKKEDAKDISKDHLKDDSKKDEDFTVDSDGESEDDEDTIMEQEKTEGNVDHKQELDDLQADNELSIEELKKKYLKLPSPPAAESDDSKMSMEVESEGESTPEEQGSSDEATTDDDDEDVKDQSEDDEDKLGLKMLVQDESDDTKNDKKTEGDGEELINDVAALAESIQPKGNTLSSTSVVTPVPFLLKLPLREYQHIGLDWLVTMYERKLNGILADEMGLGKTIQTIALLAHLACEKGDWGPHLIIVPTSVMLNWEMECKKWCPGFKILTYYGTQKERKLKRIGWTKPNAFHICITSYKLVIQDHQSFRRKKWKYLILDEAQNIKNFKSQRWQLLLNFQTQQRLLLTGTPLQNNLMELWSLMHFLMPHVFQSHREFKEWFSNPVTGMIEGNSEYNDSIIKRLHKVLRPFLLRRLKSEVEKQMPQKFEHVIMCRLSKRQRFLYDDYMSRAKTKETLATGNLLSVINVLMQLRKVCNHPNLFEVRPTISPFQCEAIEYFIPSIVYSALDYDFFKHVNLDTLYLRIINLEYTLSAYSAYRTCKYRAPKKLIECIDEMPEPEPRCPKGIVHMRVKLGEPTRIANHANMKANQHQHIRAVHTTMLKPVATSSAGIGVKVAPSVASGGLKLRVANSTGQQSYSVQLVQQSGSVKAIPVTALSSNNQSSGAASGILKSAGDQRVSMPTGFAQLVHTSLGKHILLTQSATLPQSSVNISGTTTVMTSSGQRLTVLSKPVSTVTGSMVATSANKTTPSTASSSGTVNTTTTAALPGTAVSATPISSSGATTPNTEQVGDTINTTVEVPATLPAGVSITRPLTASFVQQLKTVNPPVIATSQNSSSTSSASTSQPSKHTRQSARNEFSNRKEQKDKLKTTWNSRSENNRSTKLALLHRLNEWRCHASPMYGQDLRDCLNMCGRPNRDNYPYTGAYLMFQQLAHEEKLWDHPTSLKTFVKTAGEFVQDLGDMFNRFVFCVPAVTAKTPSYRVLNPPQSAYWREKRNEFLLSKELSPAAGILHPIASAMCTQFPDPRLIQYDCGKLQTLDLLLRKLKSEGHRVLIFTQMTRMLDVLEAFLNFHGHIYLRLDGTTKVDQRQVLMERFNGDTRIFAFILSTRSGGVGVNLTGADTVIFYDSDWNPTMDAQAQDRCHRIGQTRDVHIYRLISEKTIEENILKKANQKRMLGDLAIEGGNFTTAYFKSTTIQDLFNVDTNEEDVNARMSEVLNKGRPLVNSDAASTASGAAGSGDERAALGALENALAACEDDQDVQAARTAKAEAVADLAEFDESIPLDDQEKDPEMSRAELEVQNLIKQLTPIERYAMRFVEETEAAWSAEQLAAAEREIEEQKREWEENRLAALRQEEERRSRQQEEDSDLLTFSRDDATNQIWLSDNTKEQMPMWCPPTPPTQDTDIYIDYSMGFLYEMSVMCESQLPPVYVKKEPKRSRHDAGLPVDNRRAHKVSRKDDALYEPRSLFDRPSPEMVKMRRELKQQRIRGIVRPQIPKTGLKIQTIPKPTQEPPSWHSWIVNEDMNLLKVIQVYQQLPINLMIISPGHTPNWDFAADYVNMTSIAYRSPKQCRHRYETALIAREEGKQGVETSPRKKKAKNIYNKFPQQIKSNRPIRTAQIFAQDNNSTFTQIMNKRFDIVKMIASKRVVQTKTPPTNAHMKNPKHTAVLTEYGIDYEHPLTPVEVAARRAERIAREKQKMAEQQQQQRQAKAAAAAAAANLAPGTPTSQPSTPTQTVASPAQGTSSPGPAPQPLIQLTQASASPTITPATVTIAQVQAPSTPPLATSTLRTQRIVSSPLQAGTVTNVTGLTQAHLAQRLIVAGQTVASKGGTPAATATTSKPLTPAQLQYYRQQMLKQQQQQQLRVQGIQTQTVKGVAIANQQATVQVAVTQTQQRPQFVKQQAITVATSPSKQNVARTVSESEMAALIKRQHKAFAAAAGGAGTSGVQVSQAGQATAVQTLTQAQLLAQAGIQVQQAGASGTTQVATLVKAVPATPGGASSVTIPVTGVTLGPQVKAALVAAQQQSGAAGTIKAATATPSQIRQLQLHQQFLAQKKLSGQKITQLAQVAGKAGVATQLIVQTPKTIPAAMTMQQLQQVMRQPQLSVTTQGQVVLAKAAGGPTTRVIPMNAANAQGLKQTIQVVTATSAGQATLVRPQVSVSSTLAGALAGAIKVAPSGTATTAQQQALLSQVSAALQGQPVTVRQSGSPVRIQTASGTPLVAVTVQSNSQQQSPNTPEQVGHPRIQKK